MTLEKLAKLCLQMLEQDSDIDVMNTDISVLQEEDTFREYVLNMEHAIYMGLTRLASSLVLPVNEFVIAISSTSNTNTTNEYNNVFNEEYRGSATNGTLAVNLVENNTPIFHKIHSVYCLDANKYLDDNVKYVMVGSRIVIQNYDPKKEYHIIYHPTIHALDTYNEDVWQIELTDIGTYHICVPDEMAINIKNLVYSEMKVEESPSVAITYRNVFEEYVNGLQKAQVNNNVSIRFIDWGDSYGY